MGNKPLRVGIIGLGRMGEIRGREIKAHPLTELVIGADPDPANFRDFPGILHSVEYQDVVDADLDAIYVCTPNYITAEAIVRSLRAGKHVFSEKPPGRNLKDVEAIMAAEQENPGLKLKFGFNHRYHAGILEARRIIDSGKLGRVLWLRGIYGKSGGIGFDKSWRSNRAMAGGGILLDQGIHMLDLFRFFCGEFVEIKSMVDTAYWDIELEDNAFALLRDAQGRIAMLHSSSTHWKHRFTLEIFLSEGYLCVGGLLTGSRSYGDETITVARRKFDEGFATGKPSEEVIYFDTDPSWQQEQAEFIECILEDKPIRHGTSQDALNVMRLVFSIYEGDRQHARPLVAENSVETTAIVPAPHPLD